MTSTASSSSSHAPPDLPPQHRYITTHDLTGSSVFSTAISSASVFEAISPTLDFFLGYITSDFPVRMASDADMNNYCGYVEGGRKAGITTKGGSVLRVCNFAPGSVTPMHRTVSLDFGIVVAGEVELVLDSGETRLMKVGHVAVQR